MATKSTNTADNSVTIQYCNIGGVTENTLEAVSKLADACIVNSEAIKAIAQSIRGNPIETGISIQQAPQ